MRAQFESHSIDEFVSTFDRRIVIDDEYVYAYVYEFVDVNVNVYVNVYVYADVFVNVIVYVYVIVDVVATQTALSERRYCGAAAAN